MNLPDPVQHVARTVPAAHAVITPCEHIAYTELDQYITRAVIWGQSAGIRANQRVAFLLPNGVDLIIGVLALMRLGAVAVPLSTRQPLATLPALLQQIGAAFLITDQSGVDLPTETQRLTPFRFRLEEEREGPPDFSSDPRTFPAHQPATAVFTSGSSGHPKAALHSVGNHFFSAKGSGEHIPLQIGDRWLLSLPLYHVGGLGILFRCLWAGATIVVPDPDKPLHQNLINQKITHASMVATQLRRVVQHDVRLGAKLKAILLGGSAIPSALIHEVHAHGWPLHLTYGLTEMASQVTTTPPYATAAQYATAGTVLPHRELCLRNGEILVRGDTLFLGYLDQGDVVLPVDEHGWFATGDLGRMTPEGLQIIGRKDHQFISGGENIHPEEIERVLLQMPTVAQALVVPCPDPEFGFHPVAFVQTTTGVLPKNLQEVLQNTLPKFKIPKRFYSWPEDLPPTGIKPSRAAFQQRLAALIRDDPA